MLHLVVLYWIDVSSVSYTHLDVYKRQTLRKAEFGFFGVVVLTTVHTPRFCGDE